LRKLTTEKEEEEEEEVRVSELSSKIHSSRMRKLAVEISFEQVGVTFVF